MINFFGVVPNAQVSQKRPSHCQNCRAQGGPSRSYCEKTFCLLPVRPIYSKITLLLGHFFSAKKVLSIFNNGSYSFKSFFGSICWPDMTAKGTSGTLLLEAEATNCKNTVILN